MKITHPDPRWFIISILFIWLTACNFSQTQQAELAWQPSSTSTLTSTGTPTIIWFPATATSTAMPPPPPLPTPQSKPALGEILLADDFSDTSRWQTARDETGSIAFGKNELTLAIAKPKGNLSSLTQVAFPEPYYLEINAYSSLCRNEDSFGLFIRMQNTKVYYRLSINCMGQIKFDLVNRGVVTALTGWIPSGQVLPGPMLQLRLGIWSGERSLGVFINDVHQFTVNGPGLKGGSIGVFARSAGDNALTVNFSDLLVYEVDEDPPIPLPTLTPTRRPTKTPYVK